MRALLFSLLVIIQIVPVKNYTKKNGVYVRRSVRSKTNKTRSDNYSTRNNYSSYSGKVGKKKLH